MTKERTLPIIKDYDFSVSLTFSFKARVVEVDEVRCKKTVRKLCNILEDSYFKGALKNCLKGVFLMIQGFIKPSQIRLSWVDVENVCVEESEECVIR